LDIFLNKTFYGSTIGQWALTFSLILISVLVGRIFYWISNKIFKKLAEKTDTMLDDILIDMIEEPAVIIGVLFCIRYSLSILTIEPDTFLYIKKSFYFLIIMSVTWLITRTTDALVEHYLVPLVNKSKSGFR